MNRKTPDCPNKAEHTECPTGYVQWFEWAKKMQKTHKCYKCPGCGLYEIWREKIKRGKDDAQFS